MLPANFKYHYWGTRLAKLYHLTQEPPPANILTSWFERHASERNALIVAIIGLFLNAVIGLLGVVVGLVQIWKNPG